MSKHDPLKPSDFSLTESGLLLQFRANIQFACQQCSESMPYAVGHIKMSKAHTCPQKPYNGSRGVVTEGPEEQSLKDTMGSRKNTLK